MTVAYLSEDTFPMRLFARTSIYLLSILTVPGIHARQRLTLTDLATSVAAVEEKGSPQQIAEKHWGPNTTTVFDTTAFPISNNDARGVVFSPQSLDFDGSALYVGGQAVVKIRTSDNVGLWSASPSTFLLEVSSLVSDGSTVWANNIKSPTHIIRIRASDGAFLTPVAEGGVSYSALAFDGTNIWATDQGANVVKRIRASDGVVTGTFATRAHPCAVLFDGANIWIGYFKAGGVTKLRASDGANLGSFLTATPNAETASLTFDGVNLLVSSVASTSAVVQKVRPSDGALLGATALSGITEQVTLANDGKYLWANPVTGPILQLQISDLSLKATYGESYISFAIAFDGVHLWQIENRANTLRRY